MTLSRFLQDAFEMERWIGKTAVVTGASSGIGYGICQKLVKAGINVVGLARRMNNVEELAEKLAGENARLYPVKCDVSVEENILQAFSWIEENLGGVSIMVNNAGVLMTTTIINGDSALWRRTMDVNVLGLCICTRSAVKSMRAHEIDGQIIHIGSIAGHRVPHMTPPLLNVYSSSKHCVRAAAETLRRELAYYGSKIKISCISPGLVQTELFTANASEDVGAEVTEMPPMLKADDIAHVCMFILSASPHCQIHDVIVKPMGEQI